MTEILASASSILQGGDSEPERRNKCSSQKERRMTSPVGPAVGHSHKRVHYEITEIGTAPDGRKMQNFRLVLAYGG